MTSLVKAIQERLAKICEDATIRDPLMSAGDEAVYNLAVDGCIAAIRAADLSDLEPKGVEEAADAAALKLAKEFVADADKRAQIKVQLSLHGWPKLADMIDEIAIVSREFLLLHTECARLRLPPEMTLSDHPGCAFCMEAGTLVRPGEVCPKCGDRLPTKIEYELRAKCEALRRDAERYRWLRSEEAATNPKYYPFWEEFSVKLCRENKMDAAVDAAKDSHDL